MSDATPWRRLGQIARPGGIVCVVDHASNHVPADIDLGIEASLLNEHIAVDIGTGGIAERLARRHGIAAHIANVSRLVCDFNRAEDDPAVVPAKSDGHLIPGNIGADIEARLARFHRPYHGALAAFIAEARPTLIVAVHSFTPKLATSDEERPWDVTLLYNQDERAARLAMPLFAERGLTVAANEPYSGKQLNATMNRHAEAAGIAYCNVEIRQDRVADEAGQARWANLVGEVMERVVEAL